MHIFDSFFILDAAFCEKQINIENGKLFFFALEVPEKRAGSYKLFLSFSHICFDGLSYTPFIEKLSDFYNNGNNVSYQSDVKPFHTYDEIANEKEGESYWKQKVKVLKLSQKLPFQFGSEAECLSTKNLVIKSIIHKRQLNKFNKLCEVCGATYFQIMTMILGLVLYKYCKENIALSYTCTTNKRKGRVGCYLNLMPINFQINDDFSIKDCIELVKQERKEVCEFSNFPFKKIVEFSSEIGNKWELNVVVNESEGLLPLSTLNLSKCSAKLVETPNLYSPSELSLIYNKSSDKIIYAISVLADRVTFDALEDFKGSFEKALDFVLDNVVETRIGSLELEKKLVPILAGEKFYIRPTDSAVKHFLENCKKFPDKIAVYRGNNKGITYKELNILREKIISVMDNDQENSPVAFFLSRTEWVPAVILAMLSIGRPYVPIDVKFPTERIDYIIKSSGATVIFVDDSTYSKINRTKKVTVDVINLLNVFRSNRKSDRKTDFNINHKTSAYILFTSGSTGNPKGVIVTQGNLINFLFSMEKLLGINVHSKVLAITSVSFDISVLELILPLFVGASLELAKDEEISDFSKLGQLIDQSDVNVLQATPATFRRLRSIKWKAKNKLTIICGGEALDKELSRYLLDVGDEVYNVYGPTETTVWSSFSRLIEGDDISIGSPIYNTKYFVVNENMNSVPFGKMGQLLISGKCVSEGYINDSGNRNFLESDDVGERLYCTGDIVKYLGNEKLVYIGRNDNQVKINGYRVDISEIQSALSKIYKNIDFFIVVRKRLTSEGKDIIGFYANDISNKFDESVCKKRLKLILPGYMIPVRFYHLKKIPLNTSGKADIKFLSKADISDIDIIQPLERIQNISSDLEGICAILHDVFNIDTSDLNVSLGYLGLDSVFSFIL